MEKKIIFSTVILLAFIALGFFIKKINEPSLVIEEEDLLSAFDLITQRVHPTFKEAFEDFSLSKENLVNLVRVKKENDEYQIGCFLGSAYKTSNLDIFFPTEKISFGRIKDCDIATAKLIDGVLKNEDTDCRVFINFPTPQDMNDYYYFVFSMREEELTEEWIASRRQKPCFSNINHLVGEVASTGFLVGVMDLEYNQVYF